MSQDKRDAIISAGAKWFVGVGAQGEIYGDKPNYNGGISLFSQMTGECLQQLVDNGYADLEDAQNNSPTLAEFLKFVQKNPGFMLNGYAVTEKRNDFGIVITGLDFLGHYTLKQQRLFEEFSEGADELDVLPGSLRSWWD